VRKMKKMIATLGLVALMLFGVTYVYAQGPGFGPGHRGMHSQEFWGPGRPGKVSNLTPEQKTQFKELRRKFRQENAQLIGALVAKRLELQSLWTDPKADSNTLLQKEKELGGLQDQMREKVVQMKLEARKFLTPEQIANWKPGWGMGRGETMGGRGHMIGHGYRMGRGYGMGPGSGACY
jgi:Spy/CpxP family protein refolding chaperone